MKRQQQLLTSFFSKKQQPAAEQTDEVPSQEASILEYASTSTQLSYTTVATSSSTQPSFKQSAESSLQQSKRQKVMFQQLDIGQFVNSANKSKELPLTDEQKYEALMSCWTPDDNYSFPKVIQSGRSRSFQQHYLKTWPWLAYSEMQGGGAFCKNCILFAKKESSGKGGHQSLGVLVNSPLNKYKKAVEEIKNHEEAKYHIEASIDAENFIKWYNNKTALDVMMSL
jgi:hypothetical protein